MKLSIIKRCLLITVLAGVLVVAAAAFIFGRWLAAPMAIPASGTVYSVAAGSSLGSVVYQLQRLEYLQQPRWLLFYARLSGYSSIQAGEFFLAPGLTPKSLLELLHKGDVIRHSVTLVEGKTFVEILDQLHVRDNLDKQLLGLSLEQQLQRLGLSIGHPEGWFFPDTYQYTAGASDVSILRRAHQRMQAVLAAQWQARAENLPYDDSYEALIMASIVERETGAAREREQIAGVFVRRLRKNMRLQTDPTVIYGLGADFDGNIRRKHLRQASPYNTYMIKGLPPTPIAMPGREAIYAALHPDQGDTLYFVAKGDGSHHFSSSLDEHNSAVRRYQIYRRTKNYRSAPSAE